MPILFCDTRSNSKQNFHSSIRPTFGDVVVSGNNADAQVTINEDISGWQGTSSFIFSFDAPSWIFTEVGGVQSVGLCLRSTPHNATILHSKLGGFDTRIYSASLKDHERVYITRRRPDDSKDICHPDDGEPKTNIIDGKSKVISVRFDASGTKIDSLTLRENIVGGDVVKSLASGVHVSTKNVADDVIPHIVSRLYTYPFPIHGDTIKTRIARKSLYIEVRCYSTRHIPYVLIF